MLLTALAVEGLVHSLSVELLLSDERDEMRLRRFCSESDFVVQSLKVI